MNCDVDEDIIEGKYSEEQVLEFTRECLAELPHDPVFVHAMVKGKTVTEFSNGTVAKAIAAAWQKIADLAGVATNSPSAAELAPMRENET